MSETISLDWIGATLRAIQAEQRSIRDENTLIKSALNAAGIVLSQRIADFEAHVDSRLDQSENRLARFEARIDTRLSRIEQLLEGRP